MPNVVKNDKSKQFVYVGQFDLAKQSAAIMRKQGLGGNYISIVSKNGLVAALKQCRL